MRVLRAHFAQQLLCVGCEQIQGVDLVRKSNDCTNGFDVGDRSYLIMDGPACAGDPHAS